MSNVQDALHARFETLSSPLWVDAMVDLISRTNNSYFRWHDSGDIQSYEHLSNIVQIANRLPEVSFWLPTKEKAIVNKYLSNEKHIPSNLTIRVSNPMIDCVSPSNKDSKFVTSSVHRNTSPVGHECPSSKQGNVCGDCRACWDKTVQNVAYHHH